MAGIPFEVVITRARARLPTRQRICCAQVDSILHHFHTRSHFVQCTKSINRLLFISFINFTKFHPKLSSRSTKGSLSFVKISFPILSSQFLVISTVLFLTRDIFVCNFETHFLKSQLFSNKRVSRWWSRKNPPKKANVTNVFKVQKAALGCYIHTLSNINVVHSSQWVTGAKAARISGVVNQVWRHLGRERHLAGPDVPCWTWTSLDTPALQSPGVAGRDRLYLYAAIAQVDTHSKVHLVIFFFVPNCLVKISY